ncbi:MAG: hypothetical protein JOZ08_14560 [Verrucomicrobia bacterium]|nr:hypothetical protein [Verrucomicrobiota bacterium]
MIDLLEEAIHLLRRTSAITYAYYLLGVTPFALLFFQLLADASYHRYLAEHLGDSVIRLAVAYCWMKGFQALACQRLLAAYSGEPLRRRGPLELLQLSSAQCAIQPWGILIKPMAFIVMVPSPFVDAFFQTASIVITGNRGEFMRCLGLSGGQIGPGLILSGIIFAFRIVMFVCVYSTLAALPFLCKMLFGVETLLTHNFQWLLSVPFLLGTGFVSYLIIDLLLKSFYVIRLRRLECETSGKDLVHRLAALGYAVASK